MRRLVLLGACWVTPLLAQVPDRPDTVLDALPGAGRPIDVAVFRARRQAFARRIGPGVVLVPAASRRDLEREILQDNDFRQDDYFYYLTGLEAPDAWLLLEAGAPGADEATLFLRPVNAIAARWTGAQLGPGDEAARLTGIARVEAFRPGRLDSAIAEAVARAGQPLLTVVSTTTAGNRLLAQWAAGGRKSRNVVATLDSMRVVKDDHEIRALRRAIAITAEGIRAGMRAVRPGMFEYQLEAVIEYTFRSLGADRLGYPSIVGSGPNGTILHYDQSRRRMAAGELVVTDVGAEYAQYTADVTRTFPVSGSFTDRQRAVYELVLGVQDAVIAAVRPGATVAQLNVVARQYLSDKGRALCGGADCSRFLIHGVSHWIGMRVHDVGDGNLPLVPGMVLTVEPGLYFPDEALGVRIEDDVLVTERGAEVLSTSAPRTVAEIETWMRSGASTTGTRE